MFRVKFSRHTVASRALKIYLSLTGSVLQLLLVLRRIVSRCSLGYLSWFKNYSWSSLFAVKLLVKLFTNLHICGCCSGVCNKFMYGYKFQKHENTF